MQIEDRSVLSLLGAVGIAPKMEEAAHFVDKPGKLRPALCCTLLSHCSA